MNFELRSGIGELCGGKDEPCGRIGDLCARKSNCADEMVSCAGTTVSCADELARRARGNRAVRGVEELCSGISSCANGWVDRARWNLGWCRVLASGGGAMPLARALGGRTAQIECRLG